MSSPAIFLTKIACDLLDQVKQHAGGYEVGWSFGGGIAMMIQIGHRESHDVDIFIDDGQILGFLDPAKVDLHFKEKPADYGGNGAPYQKFAFTDIGEIDFIASARASWICCRRRGLSDRNGCIEASRASIS